MPDDLEKELRNLHPINPSPELESRIDAQIGCHASGPNLRGQKHASCASINTLHPRLSDRLLLSTMSAALAASILIITLLTTDYLNNSPAQPRPTPADQSASSLTLADTPRLLAQLTQDPTPPPHRSVSTTIPE